MEHAEFEAMARRVRSAGRDNRPLREVLEYMLTRFHDSPSAPDMGDGDMQDGFDALADSVANLAGTVGILPEPGEGEPERSIAEILGELFQEVRDLHARIDKFNADVTALTDRMPALEEGVTSHESRLDSFDKKHEAVLGRLRALESKE